MTVRQRKSLQDWGGLALRGAAMGVAELVPGISGGTIALVTGIYAELLGALRALHPGLVVTAVRQGPRTAFHAVGGWFLIVLGGGMVIAAVSMANLLDLLLATQPIAVWAFFFGLILASIPVVWTEVLVTDSRAAVAALAGLALALLVQMIEPADMGTGWPWLFMGGAVAISAWVLPGVSGSFILLLLGLYVPTLTAIRSFDVLFLAVLASGCAFGLLCFVQVLGALMDRYRSTVMAFITGVMSGSLVRLWPWQYVVTYRLTGDGESTPIRQTAVTPWQFEVLTGDPPVVLLAATCMVIGAVVIGLFHWAGRS